MLKKAISLVLVVLVFNGAGLRLANADSGQGKEARRVEEAKKNVRKLGAGPEARVEIKLRDNRRVKGYIKEAGEDSFVIIDEKTGAASTVDYSQVLKIKGSNGLTAAKVGVNIGKGVLIVAGVAAAFTLLAAIFVPKT